MHSDRGNNRDNDLCPRDLHRKGLTRTEVERV